MFSNQSAEVSLNAPCKSIAAVLADRVESRFLVGTCSVQDDNTTNDSHTTTNQLHVIRYHSDVNVLGVDASLDLPPTGAGPIQHLCASPHHRTVLITLAEQATQATLYKLPYAVMELTNDYLASSTVEGKDHHNRDPNNDSMYHDSITSHAESSSVSSSSGMMMMSGAGETLESKVTLESSAPGSKLLDVKWRGHPDEDSATPGGDVVTLDDQGTVVQWDLSLGLAESMTTLSSSSAGGGSSDAVPPMARPRVAWDPHHAPALAVTWGTALRFLDLRTSSSTGESAVTGTIARAHRYGVTDIDYNPNKPYTCATSGLDGLVKFWDIRTTRRPIMTTRGGHSHYAWRVQYNPFHDQLVVSTGTDAVVNLWRLSTISSAPLLPASDGLSAASETSAPNVRVARHEQGDSVYGAVWSAADAWMYTTVAYDGKVALHHVPSKEKYKILL